ASPGRGARTSAAAGRLDRREAAPRADAPPEKRERRRPQARKARSGAAPVRPGPGLKVRLGGRGSQLSLAQLEIVRRALARRFEVEIVTFTTTGDRLSGVDGVVTGKDLFTREVDEALRDRRIDLGVHSAKDLPSQLPGGLAIAAVPLREDPSDVVVSRDGGRLLA